MDMKRLFIGLLIIFPGYSCDRDSSQTIRGWFTSPASNQMLVNGEEIEISIKADGVPYKTTFYLDDELIGTVSGSPVTILWTPAGRSGGNRIITAQITSAEGDVTTCSVPVYFPFEIGETSQGGKVYFTDESRQHGFSVALEDLSFQSKKSFLWGPEQFIGATDSVNGASNTQVLASNSYMGAYPWSLFKLGYISNGYSDWYVPSKTEMLLLTEHLKELDGVGMQIMSGVYWTSTECCRSKACAIDMETFKTETVLKAGTLCKIRPVRKF
jgi:hypothetical protein